MFQVSAYGLSGAEDTKLGYYNGPTVTVGSTAMEIKASIYFRLIFIYLIQLMQEEMLHVVHTILHG